MIEMVVDGARDVRAEPVAGVISDPAPVIIVASEDADGDRSFGPFDDPNGRARVVEATGLESDLGFRRQKAR